MTGYTLERPACLTCPECGGTLQAEHLGTLLQYRCHIGHVLGADTMLLATCGRIEGTLGTCLAQLNERADLCRQIAEGGGTDRRYRTALEAAATQARQRADVIRNLLESEWLQPRQSPEESAA